jgi:hypothetical protein
MTSTWFRPSSPASTFGRQCRWRTYL